MRSVIGFFCMMIIGWYVFAYDTAHAYESMSITNGGSIKGVVTFSGTPPPPQTFKVTMGSNPEFCRAIADKQGNVQLPRARISSAHEVADVVVFIQELDRGKPTSREGPVLTVDRCQFDHLVTAGMDGQPLRIKMNDPILHQLRGWEMLHQGRIPLFHFPDLGEGAEKSALLTTRRSGMVKVECDQHRFMQAWILVPLNPYFSVTNTDGTFTIKDIPPGTYTLSAWHPTLGYQETSVTVTADHEQHVTFSFKDSPS